MSNGAHLIAVHSEGSKVTQPLTNRTLTACYTSSETNNKWSILRIIYCTL